LNVSGFSWIAGVASSTVQPDGIVYPGNFTNNQLN
jgi:hypothetical protein